MILRLTIKFQEYIYISRCYFDNETNSMTPCQHMTDTQTKSLQHIILPAHHRQDTVVKRKLNEQIVR
jgi:hypothetical protein